MLRLTAISAACLLAFGPHATDAATMTFDNMGSALISTHTENGITATTGSAGYNLNEFGGPNLHMDDGGTTAPFSVTFTMGKAFDAIGFILDPLGFDYTITELATDEVIKTSFANVSLQGFRDGTLVAESIFDMGSASQNHTFGNSFTNLTSLVMGFATPPLGYLADDGFFASCSGSPCSHYTVDNVQLAAVPLPATMAMLGAGLGLLGLVGWRRRRAV